MIAELEKLLKEHNTEPRKTVEKHIPEPKKSVEEQIPELKSEHNVEDLMTELEQILKEPVPKPPGNDHSG